MFTVLNKVLKNERIDDTESKKVSEFIFLRWLSFDKRTIKIASLLNCFNFKQLEISQTKLLNNVANFLNKKISFIKYIGKSKLKNKEDILAVCHYFNVSIVDANLYLEDLSKKDLKHIKEQYNLHVNGVCNV